MVTTVITVQIIMHLSNENSKNWKTFHDLLSFYWQSIIMQFVVFLILMVWAFSAHQSNFFLFHQKTTKTNEESKKWNVVVHAIIVVCVFFSTFSSSNLFHSSRRNQQSRYYKVHFLGTEENMMVFNFRQLLLFFFQSVKYIL